MRKMVLIRTNNCLAGLRCRPFFGGAAMNPLKTLILLTLASLLLAGCMTNGIEPVVPYDQVDVFGIRILSANDHRILNGVEAIEET